PLQPRGQRDAISAKRSMWLEEQADAIAPEPLVYVEQIREKVRLAPDAARARVGCRSHEALAYLGNVEQRDERRGRVVEPLFETPLYGPRERGIVHRGIATLFAPE